MKRIFTTSILSLLVLFSFAQDTGTVKGTIKDKESGETIIGASVVWEADKGRGAATDFDGNFSLILPVGEQKVLITSMGYEPQSIPVSVKKGETTTISIDLGIGAIQKGMVVVSAGKFEQKIEDLTVSIVVIKPDIIESRGSTSAEDVLEQTPGLTILDGEAQMRGGSGYSFGAGSRVMLLVDDLPILSGDAGRPSWGFLPTENLSQIEVIKGASSVLYGSSALNGIINIRTAYPTDKPKTKINLFSGFYSPPGQENARWGDTDDPPIYGGMNFFHSRKVGTWDIVAGGNILLDNDFIGPESGDTLIDGVSHVTNTVDDDLGNQIDSLTTYAKPSKGFSNRFRFNLNIRKRSKSIPGLAFGVNTNVMFSKSAGSLLWLNNTNGLFRPYGGSITRTVQTSYNIDPFVSYSGSKGSKHTLRTRVFHQNNDNSNNQGNLNYVFFGEYQFAHRFAQVKDLTITVGTMGQYSLSEAELYAGKIVDGVIVKGDGKNNASNAAVYVQVDKKFWNRLNVNGGARFEYFSVNGSDTIIRPVFRLGASSKLWKEGYLRASFGEGFRFPSIAERYIFTTVGGLPIVPNPNIEPERSWAAELGLMQGIKIGKFLGYLDIAGFYQHYTNFVEFTAGSFAPPEADIPLAFKSLNTGNSRVYGIDVSLSGNGQFTDWFGINILAGYTYSRPESLEPEKAFGVDNAGQELTQVSTSSILYGPDLSSEDRAAATAEYLENPILKYRFEHLANVDLELVFTINKKHKLSIAGTYRYYSFMKSVDMIFYQVEAIPNGPFDWGGREFRENNDQGDHVFDLRASFDFTDQVKLGIMVKNVANRVYALRPLKINAPRTTQLQLTVSF
ncbi:MAG: iron complex outermembrane receptor protein [Bacteroidia bacterium]|jgi:outer membrane receptor protein involved in Fe transport